MAEVERLLGLSRDVLARLQQNRGLPARGDGFATSFALDAASISEGLREELQQTRSQLRLELLALTPPALIEAPTSPTKPVAPRKLLNVVLAAVLGLVAGAALALTIEALTPVGSTKPLISPAPAIGDGQPSPPGDAYQ